MTDIKNVDKYQQALNKYNLNITDVASIGAIMLNIL